MSRTRLLFIADLVPIDYQIDGVDEAPPSFSPDPLPGVAPTTAVAAQPAQLQPTFTG